MPRKKDPTPKVRKDGEPDKRSIVGAISAERARMAQQKKAEERKIQKAKKILEDHEEEAPSESQIVKAEERTKGTFDSPVESENDEVSTEHREPLAEPPSKNNIIPERDDMAEDTDWKKVYCEVCDKHITKKSLSKHNRTEQHRKKKELSSTVKQSEPTQIKRSEPAQVKQNVTRIDNLSDTESESSSDDEPVIYVKSRSRKRNKNTILSERERMPQVESKNVTAQESMIIKELQELRSQLSELNIVTPQGLKAKPKKEKYLDHRSPYLKTGGSYVPPISKNLSGTDKDEKIYTKASILKNKLIAI